MPKDEVTDWFERLSEGDSVAAHELWDRYFEKLVRYADRRLRRLPRRAVDEEDVALSAINSFFRGAKAGRFAQVKDSEALWKLLLTITARKAAGQIRRAMAQKRGQGEIRGESVFDGKGDGESPGIANVLGEEPTPELAAEFAEGVEQLLQQLEDDTLREIALLKLEGFTNAEIAAQTGRHERTVDRKLRLIRKTWERERSPRAPTSDPEPH